MNAVLSVVVVLISFFSSVYCQANEVLVPDNTNCSSLVAAVVDPYSSGGLYAEELRRRGFDQVIAVRSAEEFPVGYEASFKAGDFDSIVVHNDLKDPAKNLIVSELQKLKPRIVLIGAESGVWLGDALSERLGVLTNGTALSLPRRNKFHLKQTLRQAGLSGARVTKQLYTNNVEEMIAWWKKEFQSKGIARIVIKPPTSFGTQGVRFAHNEQEIRQAFHSIFGKRNDLLLINDEVLGEFYIPGTEYAVNGVVADGIVEITDIWEYERDEVEGGATVYRRDTLIPYDGERQRVLRAHAQEIVGPLGIKWGPVHIEMKIHPSDGFAEVVELAVRPCGANLPALVKLATGTSQIERAVDAYLQEKSFVHRNGYTIKKNTSVVFLKASGDESKVMSRAKERVLRSLEGVHSVSFTYQDGQPMKKTRDSDTVLGVIELLHSDANVIEQTVQKIRDMEFSGDFERYR
ncbi:MAG: ATP-grasp domain-containing protein [Bacteriovoracia bacterium]